MGNFGHVVVGNHRGQGRPWACPSLNNKLYKGFVVISKMVSNKTSALFIHFCEYGDFETTSIKDQFMKLSARPDFEVNMVKNILVYISSHLIINF